MKAATERFLHSVAMVLCLPLAAIGAWLPANEYVSADGLVGAVDCDGPMHVLLFAGTAFIFYASNAAGLFWVRKRPMRWHLTMGLFCLLVSLMVLPNTVRAFVAIERNKSELACN